MSRDSLLRTAMPASHCHLIDCPRGLLSPSWMGLRALRSHVAMRKHANKTHDKKGVVDEDISKMVRLQSWFGEKRERC